MPEPVIVESPEDFTPRLVDSPRVDPFNPVLLAPVTPVELTDEQIAAIITVLQLTSSDTKFAEKALTAIRVILLGGSISGMILSSVEPPTKVTNSSTFKLKCKGTGFNQNCTILMNGVAKTTTFVSATELSTDINTLSTPPQVITVVVRNTAGLVSNAKTFTVTAT